jgi:hypothetical protein
MLQLTGEEATAIRSQVVTLKTGVKDRIALKPNCVTAVDELTNWLELQDLPVLPVPLVPHVSRQFLTPFHLYFSQAGDPLPSRLWDNHRVVAMVLHAL